MTMDLEPKNGGSLRFRLGPVEKLLVTFVIALLSWLTYSFIDGVGALKKQVETIDKSTVRIEEKVSNGNKTLDSLLPMVADHTIKLTDHEARIKQLEKTTDDLQKVRNLR